MQRPRYEVTNIVRVPPGRARQLRATFDLKLEGLAEIRLCRYLVDGRRRFILGPSLQDAYRGWCQVVFFDDAAAGEILGAFDQAVEVETNDQVLGSEGET
jgi:hypothetical protein